MAYVGGVVALDACQCAGRHGGMTQSWSECWRMWSRCGRDRVGMCCCQASIMSAARSAIGHVFARQKWMELCPLGSAGTSAL